ncbi:MAG: trypsin-like peptidase domain-containing protein [Verrucomicrobia bacterium]|nr:trypsin-like peptidase domain-containing protein [Verrucomicrobiota bacterium]
MIRPRVFVPPRLLAPVLALATAFPLLAQESKERPAPTPAPATPAMSVAKQLNEAFVSVFERVAPAVVVIDVTKKVPNRSMGGSGGGQDPFDFFQEFFNRQQRENGSGDDDEATPPPRNRREQRERSTPAPQRPTPRAPQSDGSGFIIKADGYILTNFHVIEDGDKITVRLKDGRTFPAKVVGTDPNTDIAVIKVDATGLPTAAIAENDSIRVGEIVFAIGAPFNLDYTFTSGVVSAKGRNRLVNNPRGYEDYIQTDASINPGNSGGPLVNLDGQVVGMNTLINGINRGLGFAIPASMLRDIGGQLMENGRVVRSYLGIRIDSVEDFARRQENIKFDGVKAGVVVVQIDPETPAYRSDLKPADVITAIDGREVRTADELRKIVVGKKVGTKLDLTVVRKGKVMQIAVTTAELPGSEAPIRAANPGGREKQKAPGEEERATFHGLEVQSLTPQLASQMGLRDEKGVVVTSVADGSPAAEAQLRVKDVITEVGDKPVTDLASFKEAMKESDAKRGVLLYVARGGKNGGGKTFVVIKESK